MQYGPEHPTTADYAYAAAQEAIQLHKRSPAEAALRLAENLLIEVTALKARVAALEAARSGPAQ